jgi:ABC-type nitrate/sulfonate/bicarbonate transport system substrate-binding protein
MRRIRPRAIPLVSALAVFLLLCTPAHAAFAPAKIFFAYGTLSARLVPLWIAEEQGFFKKYGVPA